MKDVTTTFAVSAALPPATPSLRERVSDAPTQPAAQRRTHRVALTGLEAPSDRDCSDLRLARADIACVTAHA